MQELKIVDVNGEAGLALPEELLQRWGLQLGDEIEVVVEDGRLVIVPPTASMVRPSADLSGPFKPAAS